MVFLKDKFDTFVLKPFYRVFRAEGTEHLPYQFIATWIGFSKGRYSFERVGQVAASAAGNSDFGQWSASFFKDIYPGLWQPSLQLY